MGMIDSFYDEDATCPKCGETMTSGWQTKHLQRLNELWRKGDFLQYRKPVNIGELEGEKRYRGSSFPPMPCESEGYASDAPLLFNGKIPVHQTCDNCHAWLGGYARILDGKFVSIVEIEVDRKDGELVMDRREETAKSLREEFARRFSGLQESCKHEKSDWMDFEWAPGHVSDRVRVCRICERILESNREKRSVNFRTRCLVHGTMKEESGFCPRCAEEWP